MKKTTPSRRKRRTIDPGIAASVACLALTAAVPAWAQDALGGDVLGGGRALDANLSRSRGRFNAAGPRQNFNARNLIITDNVIGGRGFRGVVDYLGEGAFAGETGSDDQRRFRADSAWSSPNFANFTQTYQQVRFGQDIGIIEYASVGMDQSARALRRDLYRPDGLMDRQVQVDRSTIQAALANVIETSIEPSIVGGMRDDEGRTYLLQASSLGGLQRTPMGQAGQLLGLSSLDFAWISQHAALTGDTERASNIGSRYESDYTQLTATGGMGHAPTGERIESYRRVRPIGQPADEDTEDAATTPAESRFGRLTTGDSGLMSVQLEIAGRYARFGDIGQDGADPARVDNRTLESLDSDLERLREYLGASRRADADPVDDAQRARTGRLGLDGSWQRRGSRLDPQADDPDAEEGTVNELPLPRTIEEFGMILRHGQRIDQLAAPDDDRFSALMKQAEQSLRSGRYLRAERKFERALRLIPGHPLATAGLANTQIGAGLYVSAALTLRDLYKFQPEMIDAGFATGLMPVRPRLLDAVDVLRTRIDTLEDRSMSGFLLAYVGRLLGERDDIEAGLRVMEEDAPDDPLLPLLKSIWLAQDE